MTELFSPVLLYVGCAVGAGGVCLALPRRGVSPQVIGAILGAVGLGLVLLAVGLRTTPSALPGPLFYIFSLIALGASLRVISHPRPVYAALYFILTIVSSAGLYLLLSAEFMAFALIIVYAGAILITYLFVIMLATESPTADAVDALQDYDRYSREPIVATVAGFAVLAALTTMIGNGAARLPMRPAGSEVALLQELPLKIQRDLVDAGVMTASERIVRGVGEEGERGAYQIDLRERTAVVASPDGVERTVEIPAGISLANVEGIAFSLLNDHPGAIEMAGVVLLMAMLGAVVLARKKVEMDDAAKRAAATRLREEMPTAPGAAA
ncbi:MAG: NADH-quinone oxidoreductase subunit J [Phycisphaeraceae bacterium]|nr:NADH-quinone oxidoreductase subunit J [Phycisphaeraceae bacterium]